jgi:UDP-galactopyranose mutase
MQVAIAGAGVTGATIARLLAEAGHNITIYEQRNHVAGNCHTKEEQGVLVHRYGAHIFHTDNE